MPNVTLIRERNFFLSLFSICILTECDVKTDNADVFYSNKKACRILSARSIHPNCRASIGIRVLMNLFYIYNAIQIGFYLVLLVAFTLIIHFIDSKPMYFAFLRNTFRIGTLSNDEKNIVLDIYGKKMDFSTHRRLRISLRVLTVVSLHIISVIFIDGCMLSTTILSERAKCPSLSETKCFHSQLHARFNVKEFFCLPDEPLASMNLTAGTVICYTWMIKYQGIGSILGQLGVCSSILTLLGLTFKGLYTLANWKIWGKLLTVALGLALIVLTCVFSVFLPTAISFLAFVLAMATVVLLVNALALGHLVRRLGKTTLSAHRDLEP
jgi:hypothetical protein